MICFPDTSIIIKLAAFDLISESLSALGATPQDAYILAETKRTCPGREFQNKYGRFAVSRAQALIAASRAQTIPIDPLEHSLLSATDGIDAGEVVLFALTRNQPNFVVLTDDKRSLRALAAEPTCAAVFARLQGRVICLEQLLLRIIAQRGYENILPKLRSCRSCVHALEQALSANPSPPQLQVETALQAAVERLRLETNHILSVS